jgi:hypothetical protein
MTTVTAGRVYTVVRAGVPFSKTGPRVWWHDQGEQEGHVTMVDEQPKWRTGKLCYIEIPAVDVARPGRDGSP